MRKWDDEMGEISGFGGGYEECCRAVVLAGIDWAEKNPKKDPRYKGAKGVFGLCVKDNSDAKELDNVLVGAAKNLGGLTGAMHQAAVQHVLLARRDGWDKYRAALIEAERKRRKRDESVAEYQRRKRLEEEDNRSLLDMTERITNALSSIPMEEQKTEWTGGGGGFSGGGATGTWDATPDDSSSDSTTSDSGSGSSDPGTGGSD